MHAKKVLHWSWIVFLAGVIMTMGNPTVSLAAHHEEKNITAEELQENAAETYESFKKFTLEQREEAMAAAQKKLKELDRRTADLQKDIDNRWQDMSQATQEKTRETLDALRKERENLAEWYGGIRYSSKEAWEDVKKGFADSYDRMKKAFQDAKKDFDRSS